MSMDGRCERRIHGSQAEDFVLTDGDDRQHEECCGFHDVGFDKRRCFDREIEFLDLFILERDK